MSFRVLSPLIDLSGPAIRKIFEDATVGDVFLTDPRLDITPGDRMFDRMAAVLADTNAGIVYADSTGHPRIDYQAGSIRDDFDFGPVIGVSREAAREAFSRGGVPADSLRWGGLYDLRLRISEIRPILRIPEPLYTAGSPAGSAAEQHFAYVDPRQ